MSALKSGAVLPPASLNPLGACNTLLLNSPFPKGFPPNVQLLGEDGSVTAHTWMVSKEALPDTIRMSHLLPMWSSKKDLSLLLALLLQSLDDFVTSVQPCGAGLCPHFYDFFVGFSIFLFASPLCQSSARAGRSSSVPGITSFSRIMHSYRH